MTCSCVHWIVLTDPVPIQYIYTILHNSFISREGINCSGGSRISHRGRGPVRGDVDFQRRCFLLKMYVKMKELGPLGRGVRRKFLYVDPPMNCPLRKFNTLLIVVFSRLGQLLQLQLHQSQSHELRSFQFTDG